MSNDTIESLKAIGDSAKAIMPGGVAAFWKDIRDSRKSKSSKQPIGVEQSRKFDFPDEAYEYFAEQLKLAKNEVVIALFGSPIYDAEKEKRDSRKKFYDALDDATLRGVTVSRIYLIRNYEDFDSIIRLMESNPRNNKSNYFSRVGCYVGNIQGASETPWLDLMLIDSKEILLSHNTSKNQSYQETLASTSEPLKTIIIEHLRSLWRGSYEIYNQKGLDREKLEEVKSCLD